MPLAKNNAAVEKSIEDIEPSLGNFGDMHRETVMDLTERRAVRFKIAHSKTKNAEPGYYYNSPNFTVGGHGWCLHYFPRGQRATDGTKISLYLRTHNPSYSTFATYVCTLMDQDLNPTIPQFGMCHFSRNTGHGWHDFAETAEVEKACKHKDDVVIDCELSVYKIAADEELARKTTIVVPPSEATNLLETLLESKDMADTIFAVDGETIAAHKLVLAARSPVFRSMLYGSVPKRKPEQREIPDIQPMSETESDRKEISDIEPASEEDLIIEIPKNTTLGTEESSNGSLESNMAAQHLLQAADNYKLDRLKLICEEILCKDISINTVAITLALAHQHNCHQLKDACLEFLTDPQVAHKVILTTGFAHLMQSCPEVMMELRAKINQSH